MRRLDTMSENTKNVQTVKPTIPPAGYCTPCGAKLGDDHEPGCPIKASIDHIRSAYAKGGSL